MAGQNRWTLEIRSRLAGSRRLMRTKRYKGTPARARLRETRQDLARLLRIPAYERDIVAVRVVLLEHDAAVRALTGRQRLSHPPLNP